jgi:hypothetical protein
MVPEKTSVATKKAIAEHVGSSINGQSLGRIVAGWKTLTLFISTTQQVACVFVHCPFRRWFQIQSHIVPCGPSVAGFGVTGPLGPRTGSSSGLLPGSSCGDDGSPGSRIGGGTSGRGLPGGSSRGGSVGCPGVAGGISGGSIGIGDNDVKAAMFRRDSDPEHDPEKCEAVFRKDHAQTRSVSAMTIQPNLTAL